MNFRNHSSLLLSSTNRNIASSSITDVLVSPMSRLSFNSIGNSKSNYPHSVISPNFVIVLSIFFDSSLDQQHPTTQCSLPHLHSYHYQHPPQWRMICNVCPILGCSCHPHHKSFKRPIEQIQCPLGVDIYRWNSNRWRWINIRWPVIFLKKYFSVVFLLN